MKRVCWVFENEKNYFGKYIFADESKIVINSVPLYHYRKPSSYRECVPTETFIYPVKINVWEAISKKGACHFEVKVKMIFIFSILITIYLFKLRYMTNV